MKTERKILKARADLLLKHPFFGSLSLRMKLQEDNTCNGTWTDGDTLAYNPYYIDKLEYSQLQGLLAHTVMHPACQHHKRRRDRDERMWNMACDYSINWILLEAGFDLPEGYLDDEKYRGKKAEDIYTELTAEFDQQGNPENAGDKDGPKSIDVDYEDGKAEGSQSGDQKDGGDESSHGKDEGSSAQNDGEMDFDDTQQPDDPEGNLDSSGMGEVRDAVDEADSGGSEGGDEADIDWQVALAQAVNQARDCGDLPGGLLRLVNELLYPRLDWRELLERFISLRARNDYSWTPPSRRHLHLGVYLPSLSTELLPEVVLAVDTSGSISVAELNQFSTELSSILESYDTTVRVLWCDLEVSSEQVFRREDLPLELAPEGGGGTDFRPAFDWVEEQDISPACLVYLTDMECNKFPKDEPHYPVLWARIGSSGYEPPFGELVDVC